MPETGFHSEWITEGVHRILLECRAGFPDDDMRFIAKVAVITCDCNAADTGRERGPRVTQVFHDNKACCYLIKIVSDDPVDEGLGTIVYDAFCSIFGENNTCQPEVRIIESGDTESDHYNHTEYLSVMAGVAVDRWRHHDEEYIKTVGPPR